MNPYSVSVIIPLYNNEKYIGEAIESVLTQVKKHMEIIVVNDGSTDKSSEVAEKFIPHIKLMHQENKGAAAARNLGIRQSHGYFLAFSDADDIWMPDHQKLLLAAFEKKPDLDMALGGVKQFISPELPIEKGNILMEELKIMPGYHPGAMLVKKLSFMKVGLLNENLHLAEFVDWFSKARDMELQSIMLDDIVYKRRIHTSNQGILKRDHLKDYTSVLREALARKRKMKRD